jgi:hypothetical protein
MHSFRWAALAAIMIASPAYADPPKGKAAASIEKVGDKAKEATNKAGDKADKAADKAGDKADDKADKAKADIKTDKAEIKKKSKDQKDELKGKVQKALKGKPMHASLREELKRHARRLARLDRIEALAKSANDDDALARVKKLISKENDRHDKWMSNFDPEKGSGK